MISSGARGPTAWVKRKEGEELWSQLRALVASVSLVLLLLLLLPLPLLTPPSPRRKTKRLVVPSFLLNLVCEDADWWW